MKLENTVESVLEAKQLLGIPLDQKVGFRKEADGQYTPFLEKEGKRWYVGDEVVVAPAQKLPA